MIQTVNDSIERTHRLTGMPRRQIVERGLLEEAIPMYGAAGMIGAQDLPWPRSWIDGAWKSRPGVRDGIPKSRSAAITRSLNRNGLCPAAGTTTTEI
jgi:hypothetical protein